MINGATPACLIAVFHLVWRRQLFARSIPPRGDNTAGVSGSLSRPASRRANTCTTTCGSGTIRRQPESSVSRQRSCLRPRELSVARTAAARANPHRRHAGPPIQTSEAPCRRGGSQRRPDPRTREPADSPRRRSSNDGAPAPEADPLTLQSQDCGGSGRRRGPPLIQPAGAAMLMPSPTAPPPAHRRNPAHRLARSCPQVRLRNEGKSLAANAGRTPTRFWLIRPAA